MWRPLAQVLFVPWNLVVEAGVVVAGATGVEEEATEVEEEATEVEEEATEVDAAAVGVEGAFLPWVVQILRSPFL